MKVFNEIVGESINIPDEPQRILSLAPNITETLFMLGLEKQIVGVSYFCNKPEEAKKKPRVGSYMQINIDKIRELEPDLVLTTTGAQRDVNKKLIKEGIPVFPLMLPTSVYGILENVWIIGNLTNRMEEARRVIEGMVERIRKISSKKPIRRYKIYWEICLGSPYTTGAPSYVDTGITLAGGENIFNDVRMNYFKPNFDDLRKRNPDIFIYEPSPGQSIEKTKLLEMIKERNLEGISAVKKDLIFIVPSDFFAHYGPSFLDAVEWLNDLLNSLTD